MVEGLGGHFTAGRDSSAMFSVSDQTQKKTDKSELFSKPISFLESDFDAQFRYTFC